MSTPFPALVRAPWLVAPFVAIMSLGCAASVPPQPVDAHAAAPAATPLVAPGDAKLGDRTRCPVSGEEFVVDADSPKAEYAGKTYYFCCPHCATKFQADPKAFVGAPK